MRFEEFITAPVEPLKVIKPLTGFGIPVRFEPSPAKAVAVTVPFTSRGVAGFIGYRNNF